MAYNNYQCAAAAKVIVSAVYISYTDFIMPYIFIVNNLPWVWLAAAVFFLLTEALTFGLTTIWFALAALVMIPISFSPIPPIWQALIFLCIASVLLIFTRPIFIKKLKVGKTKTNVDALIGKKAQVISDISEFEKGEIKVSGVVWAAQTSDGSPLSAGNECVIDRIEGTTAIVQNKTAINRPAQYNEQT